MKPAGKKSESRELIVINAENATTGRLASFAAKNALLGKKIVIVNSEKAVITGRKKEIEEKYLRLRRKGGSAQKGPFFPSNPERILKRTVRGMLPYKKERGRAALKRVRCYNKVPPEFENIKKIKSSKSTSKQKVVSLKELANKLKSRIKKQND